MRVLFLTNDLRVKHFHMASAIRANMDVEIHLMHIWPAHRVIQAKFGMFFGKGPRARFVDDAKESRVFDSVQRYSAKAFEKLLPNVVYVNDLDGVKRCYPPFVEYSRRKIVCDIEDLSAIDIDVHKSMTLLHKENELISNPDIDMFLFGSSEECEVAHKTYTSLSRCSSRGNLLTSTRVQYPFVAESTIPLYPNGYTVPKTEKFSVVYAGSIWAGGYRDNFSTIKEFGKRNIRLDVYMLNSWNKVNWQKLTNIADKYPSVRAFPRLKLYEVKDRIQQYHAGLYLTGNFNKVRATYGMKPLEYAYAGVVPVGITDGSYEIEPVKNLSNGMPFGAICTIDELAEAGGWIDNNLKNFDWEFHLMDNHIDEFKELV